MTDDDSVGMERPDEDEREEEGRSHPDTEWPHRQEVPDCDDIDKIDGYE